MAKHPFIKWLVLILAVSNLSTLKSTEEENKKIYIVQMDRASKPNSYSNHIDWYTSKLKSANQIVYRYDTAFHGVAAHLSEAEALALESEHGVLGVFPETKYELHTTRSPKFLGLNEPRPGDGGVWSTGLSEHDVVVGVLDTGIWPESESFSDAGMGPVPARWKGECEVGRGFEKRHCNRKIVGARSFYRGYQAATGKIDPLKEYLSPRDQDGHGTHTAATVAGSPVRGANLLGYATGTARGMSPGARVAAYKVCWAGGCFSSDILAAVDKAVSDGVDVLSISLGGGVSSYHKDSLSVASFGAMEMGVFVSCSAGNGGPDPVTLTNVSPWITTVGASTMDRDFPATVRLGNGRNFSGASLYKGRPGLDPHRMYPVVYMGVGNSSGPDPSSLCLEGTLDRRVVAGKIVICDRGISPRVQKGQVVKEAGGVGMILANTAANGDELVADSHLLPAVALGDTDARQVKRYALAGRAKAGLAFLGTRLGVRPSPVVAAFSSRGPNYLTFEILKPDMVAPGVNILAAWTGVLGPSSLPADPRRVRFNILSGTSMSCPHVSGIAALVKSRHPQWSPAAVKSALMTTAYVHDNTLRPLRDAAAGPGGSPSDPYDHGAGHVNPARALDPGLVYDIDAQGYFEFLCATGLTPVQLAVFSKYSNRTCRHSFRGGPGDLNYPAISVVLPEKPGVKPIVVRRTATNVGPAVSEYRVSVSAFKGVDVKVEPARLSFTAAGQRLSFTVTFTARSRQMAPEFGDLVWKSGSHKVRSPMAVTWLPPM